VAELQTTASTQNHQPAPNTAPATPGPKIAHSSVKSISCDFLFGRTNPINDVFDFFVRLF
jgi:hypothetical protein